MKIGFLFLLSLIAFVISIASCIVYISIRHFPQHTSIVITNGNLGMAKIRGSDLRQGERTASFSFAKPNLVMRPFVLRTSSTKYSTVEYQFPVAVLAALVALLFAGIGIY
jgi:hypothetical protein